MSASPIDVKMVSLHCDWFARDGNTDVSVACRRENLLRMIKALPVNLLEATPDVLDTWQSDLRKKPSDKRHGATLSANTLATYTAHARAFYAWCVLAGHLDVDPSARLPRIKRPRGEAHPVPEKDLLVALAVAPEPIRTWLLLAAFMGLRAAEIAGIRRESLEEIEGRLILSGMGKGQKPFRLTVPTPVEPSLKLYMNRRGALWTAPMGGPVTPRVVSREVGRFFDRHDMPYTLHWLRHSFGTAVYGQTKDLLLTQDVMRHSSPDTTRIYVRTTSAAGTKAMDQVGARVLSPKPVKSRRKSSGSADSGVAA